MWPVGPEDVVKKNKGGEDHPATKRQMDSQNIFITGQSKL